MNCYIEVRQTERCVACQKSLSHGEKPITVRIENELGFSINKMCQTCMDTYSAYKKKKDLLMMV